MIGSCQRMASLLCLWLLVAVAKEATGWSMAGPLTKPSLRRNRTIPSIVPRRSSPSISSTGSTSTLAKWASRDEHNYNNNSSNNSSNSNNNKSRHCAHWIASTALVATLAFSSVMPHSAASAYVPTDYASETVQTTIQDLRAASGNADATFKVYENIAGIITEGKGVGGMVNYQGIQLERGYVADEDTTVYNPGLSLLTESEKERLVDAVIDARKEGLSKGQWSENNEFAFQFLREKLDPFHMQELAGFLKFAPFYAAFLYMGVLGVQQFARGAFQLAYLVGAAAFFLPVIVLIAAGP